MLSPVYSRLLLTLGLAAFLACQPPRPSSVWDGLPPPDKRLQLVDDARLLFRTQRFEVGERSFPYDCSGYVGAVLYRNGIDPFEGASVLDIRGSGTRLLYEFTARYGRTFSADVPYPGDLVFFSNTYDRNRDRKLNDEFTHVGIVESVDPDGTVTFLHVLKGETRRDVLNLSRPHVVTEADGKRLNSYLRRRRKGDPPGTPHLAGGLVTSFGSLLPDPSKG